MLHAGIKMRLYIYLMDKKKYFKMNEYQFNVYYTMVTSSTDNVYNKCTQFGSWTFHSHYIDQQQKKKLATSSEEDNFLG